MTVPRADADYVDAALTLSGYALDRDAIERVKVEFERIAAIAALLSDEPLDHQVEPVAVYRP